MKKCSKILPLLIVMLSIIMSGCSRPSDRVIEQAVRESLKRGVPVSLARYLTGGENATVEEVRVIKVGSVQGKGSYKYWPVKVYAKGTCSVMFGGRRRFKGEAEFHIRKDPYGKWVASSSGL